MTWQFVAIAMTLLFTVSNILDVIARRQRERILKEIAQTKLDIGFRLGRALGIDQTRVSILNKFRTTETDEDLRKRLFADEEEAVASLRESEELARSHGVTALDQKS